MKETINNIFRLILVLTLSIYLCQGQAENPNGLTLDRFELHGVSTNIAELNKSPYGSIVGGTYIYLRVTGHDLTPSNNIIKVGPYPCNIPEKGVNESTITCETTEAWDYNRRWGLTIEISHHEKGMAVCVGKCKFNYSESYTPVLYHMTPNTFVPDSFVRFNGVWRVSNTKNIMQLYSHNEKYGKFNCNQFKLQDQSEGPMELNPDTGINTNGYVSVECQTAFDQPAGFYDALAKTTYGDLERRYQTHQITADGSKQYNFAVTAAVESVNQSQGGNLGNILEIAGKGFGTDSSTVSINVGGLTCAPQKVTSDKITCKLASGDTSASRINGQGLQYKLFDLDGSSVNSAATFKDNFSSLADDKILSKGTLSNWEYTNMPSGKNGVYARGYFKAPSTGTYNFWIAGDDQVTVYLNTNANDVDPANTELVASRDKHSSLRNYFSPNPGYGIDSGYRGKDVSLTAGQYYYTEIYCYNGGSAGHFTVSVETPIIGGQAQINSISQLQSLNIVAEHDRETWTLEIQGQKDKEFALGFVYKDTKEKKTYTDKTAKKTWPDWTASYMASQLSSRSGGYRASVEKILLDASKVVCASCTNETAEGVRFIIQFNLRRPTEGRRGQPLQVLDSNISKSLSKTGEPSTALDGTYQLTFNGKDFEVKVGSEWVTEIPYNYSAGKILDGLKRHLNERDIGYYQTEKYSSEGIKTNFYLKTINKSLKGLVEGFKLKSNDMTGGKPGSTINIQVSNIIPGSNKPLFEPVPFDMTYSPATTSQVVVTVNNIVSVCKNDCSYASNPAINLSQTSFTQTNKNIQITMSATTGLDKTVKVWFGVQECTNVSIAGAVISCSTANIPEAGSHAPKVYVQDYGFVTQAAVKEIDLTFTNASPNSGSIRGGQKVTLTGAAFPTSVTGLVVKFKNTVAVIESVSETSIVVVSPIDADYDGTPGYSDNAISITIEFGGKSKTSAYTYSISGLATVSSLGSSSASPTLKGTIVVNGSGFGTNTALVSVWLLKKSDRSRVYELQIDSTPAMTDAKIVATLGGGASGEYMVSVENAKGGSISTGTNADFQYIIPLTGVSPTSGSKLGGTLITLTGDNFSTTLLDNAVFLSKTLEKNLQCKMVSATKTQITCLTPVMSSEFTGSLNVVVQGKLIEDSKCSGSCTFSYEDAKTGSITEDQTFSGKKGDTMTVNGTGFGSTGSVILQFPNNVQATGTVTSATQLTFDIPSVAAGTHTVVVNPNNQGFAGFITVEVNVNIESITPAIISKAGGDIVIAGSGFALSSTVLIAGVDCPIASQTTDSITCQAQPSSGNKTLKVKNNDEDSNEGQSTLDFNNSATIGATATTPGSGSSEFAANSNLQIALTTIDTTSQTLSAFLLLDGPKRQRYVGSVAGTTLNFANIPVGSYKLYVVVDGQGYVQLSGTAIQTLSVTLATPTFGSQTTSLAGQSKLSISGTGFDTQNLENNSVNVCGYPCPISSSTTFSSLKCTLPTVLTSYLRADAQGLGTVPSVHTFESSKVPFVFIADNLEKASLVQDNKRSTYYQNSGGDECFIGFDFQTLRMELTTLRYSVKQVTNNPVYYKKFHGTVLQGSNDNSTWTTLHTIGSEVHNGYNTIKLDNQSQYQYIRFFQNSEEGVSCEFAEISIWGHEYYPQSGATAADFSCEVNVEINGQKHKEASGVTYSASNTPKVNSISPTYGWQLGGTVVTVTGTGFSGTQANNKVIIDGIACVVSASTTTTITCTTGDKGISNKSEPSLQVSVENSGSKYYAIVPDDVIFYYGLLWSNDATWGGDAPPRNGDSVYVPKGQILIVDKSSPKNLKAVTVEGIILFADNQDLTFDAHYIIVRGGKFIVGTEKRAYTNKLTITLYGNYFDKQLPEVGNKVLACLQCELNLFGTVKEPVWTTISAQADPNDNTLTLTDTPTNWYAGDIIVLATTSYSGTESEELIIQSITGNVVTLETNLKYKHISQAATYGSNTVEMRAEVGNLSRNVIIQGNPEDSIESRYGGHVIIHGQAEQGSVARVSHIQFQYTGQSRIIGRYNLHFHMNGNTSKSYVKGIAVRHSNARMVALHGIHYLTVENNVGYNCMGHNIFLEDGIETHNRIIKNLVVSPISAANMLQTDMTVACIWVTNPLNYVTENHVVGSQFYGMWFEIKERPDGPSATDEICPRGMKFGTLLNNVGHSNLRFGLRFFILTPRTNPCEDLEFSLTEDLNPTIQGVIDGFVSYKNGESGILAEHVGNLVFKNTYLIDNAKSGFAAHDTSYSKEEVILENSIIAGSTPFNGESIDFLKKEKTRAIQYPRTSGFRVRNVGFYNFPAETSLLESAALNQFVKLETRGGKQHSIEQSTIDSTASSANKIAYVGPRKNYFHDKDGTLTGTNVETFISPYYNIFDQAITDNKCTKEDGAKYNDSVVCTGTQIRGMIFQGAAPTNLFESGNLKMQNLQDTNKNVYLAGQENGNDDPAQFTNVPAGSMISHDCSFCYGINFPTGYSFNMHWNKEQDFSFIKLNNPVLDYRPSDNPTVFRFNFTETRELFDVKTPSLKHPISEKARVVDTNEAPVATADSCETGEYYVDQDTKLFYLCVNGKGNVKLNSIKVDAIYCRETCPIPGFNCEKEVGRIRKFSEPANFLENSGQKMRKRPGDVVYEYGEFQSGDDVVIPCEYTMVMDRADVEFGTLIIDGILQIDATKDTHIKAKNIWIRGGKLVAGSVEQPISSKLTITLTGDITNDQIVIDDFVTPSKKALVVTGKLDLYGPEQTTFKTRLSANVQASATTISVIDDISTWKVGDQLILGASNSDGTGYEKVTIKTVDTANKSVTLEAEIQFFHYGSDKTTIGVEGDNAEVTVDGKYGGGLDMRTIVGHITRNIKIEGSPDGNLAGHIKAYHWEAKAEGSDNTVEAFGRINLHGVELSNVGQNGSENAGLNLYFTNSDDEKHSFKSISVHDCPGECVKFVSANNFVFEDNIIYNTHGFGLSIKEQKTASIKNNVFVGASIDADVPDMLVGLVFIPDYYNPSTFEFSNNVGQGSQSLCFGIPSIQCDKAGQAKVFDNEVGKCNDAGVIYNFKSGDCNYGSGVGIFHSKDGLSINTASQNYIVEKVRIVECQIGVKLRNGSGNNIINENTFKNAFISGQLLQNCADCYQPTISNCLNTKAIQLHVTVQAGNFLDSGVAFGGLDAICNQPPPYSTMYLQDVELHNYKKTYPGLENCSNNVIFRNHGSADDATAGHYLTRVKCTDCEEKQFASLENPNIDHRGWFGGCGIMDCTGKSNILIQDMTGDLLEAKGSIISNNEGVGDGDGLRDKCTYSADWNGFKCMNDNDLAMLEYEGIGSDRLKMISSPVKMVTEKFTNTLNQYREWSWNGPEPLNERPNVFVGIVEINQRYNLTYAGTKPFDMIYKLGQRKPQGEKNRHIIAETMYGNSMTIQIVKHSHTKNPLGLKAEEGEIIEPFPFSQPADLTQHTTTCGANNYFYENRTIHFVITNEPNCQIQVQLINMVQVNIRLAVTQEEFLYGDNSSNFISKIQAFLDIPTDRLKIVGIKAPARRFLQDNTNADNTDNTGNAENTIEAVKDNIITLIIKKGPAGDPVAGYKAQEDWLALRDEAEKLKQGLVSGIDGIDYEVKEVDYDIFVAKEAGVEDKNEEGMFQEGDLVFDNTDKTPVDNKKSKKSSASTDKKIAIALGVTLGVLGIAIVAGVIIYTLHKQKVARERVKVQQQDQPGIESNNQLGIMSNNLTMNEKQLNTVNPESNDQALKDLGSSNGKNSSTEQVKEQAQESEKLKENV